MAKGGASRAPHSPGAWTGTCGGISLPKVKDKCCQAPRAPAKSSQHALESDRLEGIQNQMRPLGPQLMGDTVTVCIPPQLQGLGPSQGWTWPPPHPQALPAASGRAAWGAAPHLLHACATLQNSARWASSNLSPIDFLPGHGRSVCSHMAGTRCSAEQLPSWLGPGHRQPCPRRPARLRTAWCDTHRRRARAEPRGAGAVQTAAHACTAPAAQGQRRGRPPGWQQTHQDYRHHINPAAPTAEWALTHTVKINDIYLLLIGSNKRPQQVTFEPAPLAAGARPNRGKPWETCPGPPCSCGLLLLHIQHHSHSPVPCPAQTLPHTCDPSPWHRGPHSHGASAGSCPGLGPLFQQHRQRGCARRCPRVLPPALPAATPEQEPPGQGRQPPHPHSQAAAGRSPPGREQVARPGAQHPEGRLCRRSAAVRAQTQHREGRAVLPQQQPDLLVI